MKKKVELVLGECEVVGDRSPYLSRYGTALLNDSNLFEEESLPLLRSGVRGSVKVTIIVEPIEEENDGDK